MFLCIYSVLWFSLGLLIIFVFLFCDVDRFLEFEYSVMLLDVYV